MLYGALGETRTRSQLSSALRPKRSVFANFTTSAFADTVKYQQGYLKCLD